LSAADEIGLGYELRAIIRRARELGLEPVADRGAVTFVAPTDRRGWLFTVKPQWEDGGSFGIWKSPEAFSRLVPGSTLERAQSVLGSSEEWGTFAREDTDAIIEAVASLVPDEWRPPTFEESRERLEAAGVDLAAMPLGVLRVVEQRAADDPVIALKFAGAALREDGVTLKGQNSKGTPWYYQIRHRRFPQVVAYVNVHPGFVVVDYRLSISNATCDEAEARNGLYGVRLAVREDATFDCGIRLLRDALKQDPAGDQVEATDATA
jgi:hypothetical protein